MLEDTGDATLGYYRCSADMLRAWEAGGIAVDILKVLIGDRADRTCVGGPEGTAGAQGDGCGQGLLTVPPAQPNPSPCRYQRV